MQLVDLPAFQICTLWLVGADGFAAIIYLLPARWLHWFRIKISILSLSNILPNKQASHLSCC